MPRQPTTAVQMLLAVFIVHRVEGGAKPGVGYFEPSLQVVAANLEQQDPRLDVRVAKARGDRGYAKVRISLISQSPVPQDWLIHGGGSSPRPFTYQQAFKHKWKASFNLGTAKVKCSSGVFSKTTVQYDADCMLACTDDADCEFYTWFPSSQTCELATANCKPSDFTPAPDAESTYRKYGTNYLSSAIVELTPGKVNHLRIHQHHLRIPLPAQGSGVRGIVVSDPCFSSRWVGCEFGEAWDGFNRTVRMLNALAERGDVDYFALLGDNFYDQDGRLTGALWRALSPKFKQTFLIATPGNHDIWVGGGPGPSADEFDQYAHGFMQWYAQDACGAGDTDESEVMFNMSVTPLPPVNGTLLNNAPDNLVLYHQLGNMGVIAFNGGGVRFKDLELRFREACSFMGDALGVHEVVLLGHWNASEPGPGCDYVCGTDTPHVRDRLLTMPGCREFGDRLRFVDGHSHCNHPQGKHGFMIGGHGMDGCGQVGFALLDSTSEFGLRVSYFEERSALQDRFDLILDCVLRRGVAGCEALSQPWLAPRVIPYAENPLA